MLRGGAPRAWPGAAPGKTAAQRGAAPSRPAATAPSRRARAGAARAELQRGGGGGDEASAQVFLAGLNSALRPLSESLTALNAEFAAQRSATSAEFAAQRSAIGALSENVGALAEAMAGSAVASSEWSRARACSLSELCAVLLGHEEGCDESRAVVRQLCASLAPDARRVLRGVVRKLHASLLELQQSGAEAEPLCDDTLDLRQRLGGAEPDWPGLQQLARLYEAAFLAAPRRADEACVAGALHDFAGKMAAAGTLSAAAGEQLAARLLEGSDGRARRPGPSLAFVLATAQLCGVPLFELDFDGIGQLSYCANTGVLAVPLMEVKIAPAKASEAAWQLRRRAAVACAVCLAAARCEGSPWASLRHVAVDGSVALLRPLWPQQARLRDEHAHVSLQVPSAGEIKCSAHVSFWVIGNARDTMVAR